MPGGTLWGAMDRDRRRWIRAGAIVLALLVLLGLAIWLVTVVQSRGAYELVFRILVPLAAILLFPLFRAARELRVAQSIGAVPVATGMLPDTKSALHDVSLAAGLAKPPVLQMYFADAVNAFATTSRGGLSISVSSAFAELPRAEQRAGLAMLVGRSRVDTTSFAAEHQLAESMREDALPPDRDPVLFSAWLDTAIAGDREGLRILGEPVPMIELLERLSITPTDVPGFAYAGHDAVFGFLAWPYIDTAKVLSEEVSAHGEGLPPRAAAAVAALMAEERTMGGMFGPSSGSRSLSGAEAIRALRLREVAGAEGAIAGSTTAAARRRDTVGRQSEAPVDKPATVTSGTTVGAVVTTISIPAAGGAALVAGATSAAAPVMPAPAPAGEPAPAQRGPARRDVERITVSCPACHAGNAPGNATCIACGKRMRSADPPSAV